MFLSWATGAHLLMAVNATAVATDNLIDHYLCQTGTDLIIGDTVTLDLAPDLIATAEPSEDHSPTADITPLLLEASARVLEVIDPEDCTQKGPLFADLDMVSPKAPLDLKQDPTTSEAKRSDTARVAGASDILSYSGEFGEMVAVVIQDSPPRTDLSAIVDRLLPVTNTRLSSITLVNTPAEPSLTTAVPTAVLAYQDPVPAVPIPSSLGFLLAGCSALAMMRWNANRCPNPSTPDAPQS